MTDNKLTDEQIIKFVEHAMYSAKGEDGFKEIHWEHFKDILDLINRQKAEIEKLNVDLVGMRGACESYKIHYDNAQAEIERLQNAYKQCAWERDTFLEELKTAKSEARKELAERLINMLTPARLGEYNYEIITRQGICHIVREMESKQ